MKTGSLVKDVLVYVANYSYTIRKRNTTHTKLRLMNVVSYKVIIAIILKNTTKPNFYVFLHVRNQITSKT